MVLTEVKLKSLRPRDSLYRVADANGLCVEITPTGSKLWRYRYRHANKATMVSLGAWPEVTLAQAREKLRQARSTLSTGVAPAAARQASKARAVHAATNTFGAIALEWFNKQSAGMSEATKKKTRLHLSLPRPLIPGALARNRPLIPAAFSARPIRELAAPDVLAILRPIENRGTMETLHRVHQRVSQVFRYAIATGRADRDPAADLKGALAPIIRTSRAAITEPNQIGELLRALDSYTGTPSTRAALRLAPLLFVRPVELRMMEWKELDFVSGEWRIPASKMKMRDAHTVPLSDQAIEILTMLQAQSGKHRYVFPGGRPAEKYAKPLSDAVINKALRTLGYDNKTMTGHGFRAMASTRLNEMGWKPDIIERQLAHVERNAVRAAYNRATYMQERHEMMQAWADYLDGLRTSSNKVVAINRRSKIAVT